MRSALIEADRCRVGGDQVGLTRAWKMFLLLLRLLRVCRVAGACVSLNVLVRDLDLPVAQQWSAVGGCRRWASSFLVTSVRVDGLPSRRCAIEDRRKKRHCYPELSGAHGRVWWSLLPT